jgi:hypothetical protein
MRRMGLGVTTSHSTRTAIFMSALLVVSALLGALRFDGYPVGGHVDDAYYAVLAEGLATGHGYRLINSPDEPVGPYFPPGWPLLLAPLLAISPGDYTLPKLLLQLLRLLSIPLTYWLFAPRLPRLDATLLAALVAMSSGLIGYSGILLSEISYLFCSLLALVLFALWDSDRSRSVWVLFGGFVIALYATLIRTIGVTLVCAMLAHLLLSRRFRHLGLAVGSLALVAGSFALLNARIGGAFLSAEYRQHVSHIIAGFLKSSDAWPALVRQSADSLFNVVLPLFGPTTLAALRQVGLGTLLTALAALIVLLAALGLVRSLRRPAPSDLYVVFYLAFLAVWLAYTGTMDDRFLVPMLPFVFFYLLVAFRWAVLRLTQQDERRTRLALLALTVGIVAMSTARNVKDWQDPMREKIADLTAGRVWIRDNTPADSLVMTRDPVTDFLYVRRKTLPYPKEEQDLLKGITDSGADYVIVAPPVHSPRGPSAPPLDEFTQSALLPVLEAHPDRFPPLFSDETNHVSVYAVRADK